MLQWMILGLVLLLGCAAAEAAPVNELEAGGTASNNSLATAQAIPPSAFTLPVPPTVFDPPGFRTASLFGRGGGPDVDVFRISGHGTLLLDIDNDVISSSLDTTLFVWNSSGVALAVNDDFSPIDDGTIHVHDSLILLDLPGPGVYFVGITRFFNTTDCAFSLDCSFDGAFEANGPQPDEGGDGYLLHLSSEHPHRVSVPPTLALLVCSGGLALGARLLGRRTA
jgi:hypothetical protein